MSLTNATDTPSGENDANKTSDCQPSSDSTMVTYRLVVDVYVVGILCVVGWVGNALSVAVLRRDRRRYKQGTTNWLLQTLAIVDTTYLITSVFIQPLKTIYDQTNSGDGGGDRSWFHRVYPYVEPHAWALASIAQTTTVWLVLLVTVDRFFAVCLPMKVRRTSLHFIIIISSSSSSITVTIIIIIITLYSNHL